MRKHPIVSSLSENVELRHHYEPTERHCRVAEPTLTDREDSFSETHKVFHKTVRGFMRVSFVVRPKHHVDEPEDS